MGAALLGGLTPSGFLRRHWQKSALLARGAVQDAAELVDRGTLLALAGRDDVESRLVLRHGGTWSLEHGPFPARRWAKLPPRDWTLLVQGVDRFVPAAESLLRRFRFIPYARLDDVMVSYAAPGGGVGPHFDSYDVFLVQGTGRRRWRTSSQRDLALVPDLPLKILRRFRAERQWVLSPGDMLYLPPRCAHDGVALDACTTYSVGFRAPAAQEIAAAFLHHLEDRLVAKGSYADPDLRPAREPARIGATMQARIAKLLQPVRWDRERVVEFVGCHASEPNDAVRFSPPQPALSRNRFALAIVRHGVRLDPGSRLLFDQSRLYLNGESMPRPAGHWPLLRSLANERTLHPARTIPDALIDRLYDWYRDGYLHVDR
jgi:50S ribosomal protein L16 3-hydroxylase